MEKRGKTALVLGATGLVGNILTRMLLADDRYQKVKIFVRSDFADEHPKLEKHVGDVMNLNTFKDSFVGTDTFCCIGTTKAKTPDPEEYRQIDYGIPFQAAELSVQNKVDTFVVISAMGADTKSSIFYNRIKGEMEDAVLKKGPSRTFVVRPSMIGGERAEKRPAEYFFKKLISALEFLMQGPLKKYRVIAPDTIAEAMLWLANNQYAEQRIDSETLKQLVEDGAS